MTASVGPDGAVTVAAQLRGQTDRCMVRAALRDEFNRPLRQARTTPDALTATLQLAGPLQTGPHLVTVWVTDADGAAYDWHSVLVDVPGPRIVSIEPSAARYERGQTVEASVACESLRAGLRLSAELVDTYGGVAARDAMDAADRVPVWLDSSLCRSWPRVWVKLPSRDHNVDEKTPLVPTIHDSDCPSITSVSGRHTGHTCQAAQATRWYRLRAAAGRYGNR